MKLGVFSEGYSRVFEVVTNFDSKFVISDPKNSRVSSFIEIKLFIYFPSVWDTNGKILLAAQRVNDGTNMMQWFAAIAQKKEKQREYRFARMNIDRTKIRSRETIFLSVREKTFGCSNIRLRTIGRIKTSRRNLSVPTIEFFTCPRIIENLLRELRFCFVMNIFSLMM